MGKFEATINFYQGRLVIPTWFEKRERKACYSYLVEAPQIATLFVAASDQHDGEIFPSLPRSDWSCCHLSSVQDLVDAILRLRLTVTPPTHIRTRHSFRSLL